MSKNLTSNFREQTSASGGTEPLYLLRITHPQLSQPIKVVNDTKNFRRGIPGPYLNYYEQEYDGVRVGPKFDFTKGTLTDSSGLSSVQVSRLGVATRVNEVGVIEVVGAGVARLNYDPISLSCKGLQIEMASSNLLLNSEDFSVAPWTLSGSSATVTANQTLSPDNNLAGDKLAETAVTGSFFVGQSIVKAASALRYAWSVFLKKGERNWAFLTADNTGSTGGRVWFNLLTGQVGSFEAGIFSNLTASIEPAGFGFYRCTFCFTTDAAVALKCYVSVSTADAQSGTYAGTLGSGIYMWGGMEEQDNLITNLPTSYIPSQAVPVARNPDDVLLSGVPSWYNAAQGSILIRYLTQQPTKNVDAPLLSFNNGTAAERIVPYIDGPSGVTKLGVMDNSVLQADVGTGVTSAGVSTRFAGAYGQNDFVSTLQGGTVQSDKVGTLPTIDRVILGKDPNTPYFGGHIQEVVYLPYRLPDAILQSWSSGVDLLTYTEDYIAFAFKLQLPEDIDKQLPSIPLTMDNIGREMTQWLEMSNGGRGATVEIFQVMRNAPDVTEQSFSLSLLNVKQTMTEITASLGYENFLDAPCLTATYTPETAPGVF